MLKFSGEELELRDLFFRFCKDLEVHHLQLKRLEGQDVDLSAVIEKVLALGVYELFAEGDPLGMTRAATLLSEIAGSFLLPFPLVECLHAGPYLAHFASESLEDFFESGEETLSGGLSVGGSLQARNLSLSDDRTSLSGTLRYIPEFPGTRFLLVEIADTTSPLYAVLANESLTPKPDPTLDGLYGSYQLRLSDHPIVTIEGQAAEQLQQLEQLLRASELLGICSRMRQDCATYVAERKQFGVPVGSFQAVQHALADVLVFEESLRALVTYAAWALQESRMEASLACKSAIFRATSTAEMVEKVLQLHGGIGFTWEYHVHLYLRRAVSLCARYRQGASEVASLIHAARL